jgi:hypothetical protein
LLCDRIVTLCGTGLKSGDPHKQPHSVKGLARLAETSELGAVLLARRPAMSKFQQKAEAQTKQIIGQMLGDELLVEEARELQRQATEPESTGDGHEDDRHDQGIVRDERGQEQPRDKERAERVSRVDQGGDPPGNKGKKSGAVPKRAPSIK